MRPLYRPLLLAILVVAFASPAALAHRSPAKSATAGAKAQSIASSKARRQTVRRPQQRPPSRTLKQAAHGRRASFAKAAVRGQRGLVFTAPKQQRRVKAIIFDLDGTLADTRNDIAINFKAGFKAIGIDMPMQKLLDLVDGAPLEVTYKAVRPNGTKAELQRFLDGFIASQNARGPGGTPYPKIRSMLEQLSREKGVKLAVATARPPDNAKLMLKSMGLDKHFDVIAGTDGTGMRHKPAPDVLLHVSKKLGIAPRDAVFVGDTTTDVQAGKAAGMATVAVTYGMHAASALRKNSPDATAKTAAQLRRMFSR